MIGVVGLLGLAIQGWGKDSLTITSTAFQASQEIPVKHTCQGDDLSPALSWSGMPTGTRSLVLVVEDPDAPDPAKPQRVWDHWILYNLPSTSTGLPAGVSPDKLPPGTLSGVTSAGKKPYHGPCPPVGRHRYFFKLYAIDLILPDLKSPEKKKLLEATRGHALAQAELIGTYEKKP